jgi:hypothetical protein
MNINDMILYKTRSKGSLGVPCAAGRQILSKSKWFKNSGKRMFLLWL